jgi:hypothetical protein
VKFLYLKGEITPEKQEKVEQVSEEVCAELDEIW